MNARTCVIFGGTGCIGTHVARHLLELPQVECIVLADIRPVRSEAYAKPLLQSMHVTDGKPARVAVIVCDVRKPADFDKLPQRVDLIVNLAAVHREPGHESQEYFDTNLPGAENVCAYAVRAGCGQIVFTSSISPYGPSDLPRDEDSTPVPETPYGVSKLAAEKIHKEWQQAEPDRRLVVLRPGVVFGAGEHANVARLARSLARGYFVYMGNRDTRKSGVYVKELCHVMQFALERQASADESMLLWNVSMDPPPKLEQYVEGICLAAGLRRPGISVPRWLLVAMSYPISALVRLLGRQSSINPLRMRKLSQPTHIEPLRLREAGYRFRYTMEQAMADWKVEAPEDFRR